MTTDERLDRIERLTAGIAEERRNDREEYKSLWRDTQRQINELAVETRLRFDQVADRLDQLGNRLDQLAEDSRAEDKRLGERIEQVGERIDQLISAIGQLIAKP